MKILVIGRTLPDENTGGIGIFEFGQAKGLSERNYNIVYGFVDNRSIKVMRNIKKVDKMIEGVKIIGYYLPVGGIPKSIYDDIKYRLFKQLFYKTVKYYGKPDVIHVHFPLINFNDKIIEFIKQQDVKIIATEHWSKVQNKSISNREERILHSLFTYSESIIAVSKGLSDVLTDYNRKLNYPYKSNILVIPNLIDKMYSYVPLKEDKKYTFATIGRLTSMKGNDLVIKAFVDVVKEIPNARLLIIGDGSERQPLENLIVKYDLNNQVFLTGFLSAKEIKHLFKEINVYITASKVETFGVPVIESWLLGRPVIIGNNHPMSDWVTNYNGLLFDFNNEEVIKNISKKMLEIQNVKYDHYSIFTRCANEFSMDIVINKLEGVYKSL